MPHAPPSSSVFSHAAAILPDGVIEDAQVVVREGRIESVGPAGGPVPAGAQQIDARGGYVAPGWIDIHVHGGGGADFMDGTPAAVRTAADAHLRRGTTTLFPTTTTGTPDEVLAMIDACRVVQDEEEGATIAGVHLYGPFFAPDKVGCHTIQGRRDPTAEEFERYFATDMVRIATCAAELPGAEAFYRMAQQRGCLITCGHSNASWTEMQRALEQGMRHVDHFWCAMSNVPSIRARLGTPMQGSMEQFVLMHSQMSTEVIADGCHLAAELLEFAYRMLGPERLLLVTDCNRALDMPPGRYRFGHHQTGSLFEHDGEVGRALDGGLASSARGMDHMVRVMKRSTSATLAEVIRMATLTPAERTGIAAEVGSLEAGKRADLLLLSRQLEVQAIYRAGRRIA
jgi:N-acetylglucosamine-6-phosphate deacetylase